MNSREHREFQVLRLSITPRCNLHCIYCRPDTPQKRNGAHKTSPSPASYPSTQQILSRVADLLEVLPLKEVHITGGEPTLHPELLTIVRGLRALGVPSLAMTTNGTCDPSLLQALPDAGLDRLNVSMDALNDRAFGSMGGFKPNHGSATLSQIQGNIEMVARGPCRTAINTTVLRGTNQDQILPILEWARRCSIPVRYLELMRMGPVRDAHDRLFFSMEEILAEIGSRYPFAPVLREPSATARYFQLADGYRFGIISNHSSPFCSDCNRLRMDSEGRLYGCISSERGIDFPSDAHPAVLVRALQSALIEKKSRFEGCTTSMQRIGG